MIRTWLVEIPAGWDVKLHMAGWRFRSDGVVAGYITPLDVALPTGGTETVFRAEVVYLGRREWRSDEASPQKAVAIIVDCHAAVRKEWMPWDTGEPMFLKTA